MNPIRIPPPSDAELDALLARRYHDTTSGFEARWVALKRELRNPPAPRRAPWLVGLGALTAGTAIVALLVSHPRPAMPLAPAPGVSSALAELFAMDAVLNRGAALLDRENRDALLHLPVQPQPRN